MTLELNDIETHIRDVARRISGGTHTATGLMGNGSTTAIDMLRGETEEDE